MKHIENEFGKGCVIIIGDWSGKCNFKFVSTPNISIKRKLKERFEVFEIDEYKTSCIHYKHNINSCQSQQSHSLGFVLDSKIKLVLV